MHLSRVRGINVYINKTSMNTCKSSVDILVLIHQLIHPHPTQLQLHPMVHLPNLPPNPYSVEQVNDSLAVTEWILTLTCSIHLRRIVLSFNSHQSSNSSKVESSRTEQNRTEQNRTEQN